MSSGRSADARQIQRCSTTGYQRFADQVWPYLLATTGNPQRPVWCWSPASPPLGESITVARLASHTPGADLVVLTGDALRQFDPPARHLPATDPIAMPNATAAATVAWLRMSMDYAYAHRSSLLLDGTFRGAVALADR
jgi:hypothetical protein